MISKLDLDAPNENGVSPRKLLLKVYEQSGIMPKELEEEVHPAFWDEPLFETFFEMFQADKEFFQTIYYYQKVMGIEFDGEDLTILNTMWQTAQKHLMDKERAKRKREAGKGGKKKGPMSKIMGR